MNAAIAAFLVPIVWVLLGRYVFRPITSASKRYLPAKVHEFLSKER